MIPPFDPNAGPILLKRHANGGWSVWQEAPSEGLMGRDLGAFSNDFAMLSALGKALDKALKKEAAQ